MTTPRRRLLFLAPVVPSDRGNGLAMRTGFFLDAYSSIFDIDLAVLPLMSASDGASAFVRSRVKRLTTLRHPGIDTHLSLVMAMHDPAARLPAFRRYGWPSLAGFSAEEAYRALAEWTAIDDYDVVHFSRLYLARLVEAWKRSARRPRLLVDCDEDDARAYRRMAALGRRQDAWRAAWADAEADAFATLARDLLPRFDCVFAATPHEKASLSEVARRVEVIANVAPRGARMSIAQRRRPRTVLFVGTMGYAPNEDGARWFVTRVWPRLRRAVREPLRLLIVGRNPAESLRRLGRRRGVMVTGAVRDVGAFYRQADLAVIPVRAGGGSRIKLLEAAAWRLPIVSTRLGAEGITFRHGCELLIADDAGEFARACAAVLRNRALSQGLVTRASLRLASDYDARRWARILTSRVAAIANKDEDHAGDLDALGRTRGS
jgi:glycosyltransferase involved in cell wall biosynthesis